MTADLSRFVNAVEYSRRNMAHANAVGAHANTKAALARLLKMKRPPMWLVAALEGIERRTAVVHPEVAAWRNSAPDNPYGVAPSVPTGYERDQERARRAVQKAAEHWPELDGLSPENAIDRLRFLLLNVAGVTAAPAPTSGPFTLEQMVAFLCGEASLDGVWFGEQHPGQKGAFWWRKFLRAAVPHGVVASGEPQGEKR